MTVTPVRPRRLLTLVVINAALTLLLAVLGLAAIEAYLRLTIPSSSGGSIFESTLATRRYKVMKPNTRIVAWGSEFQTNELGFRDRQSRVPPKAPGEFRIVVLGDSFTASAGVDFDKIFTTVLQGTLQKEHPSVRVLNLAVGGYNIVQYQMVLDEVGLSLSPDLVVVAAFPFNDLSNETYRENYQAALRPAAPSQTRVPWFRRLYVYRAILSKVESRIALWRPASPPAVTQPAHSEGPSEADENLQALDAIFATTSAHGIPAVLVLLPNTDDFAAQRPEFAPFEQRCRTRRWRCVNLLDGFAAAGLTPRSLRLNLLDAHPNESYSALVARLLAPELSPLIGGHPERQPVRP